MKAWLPLEVFTVSFLNITAQNLEQNRRHFNDTNEKIYLISFLKEHEIIMLLINNFTISSLKIIT